MIKIKKITDEVLVHKIVQHHVFEVNGKTVHVESWNIQDMEAENYDAGTEIDEKDLEALTEEEFEIFGENLNDYLELKEGEHVEEE